MKTSDFDKNLCFTSTIFYRLINKIAAEELTFTGLSNSYGFLIVAVKNNPGIRISELSKKLYLEISTVTRLIEKLEGKNILIRESIPGLSRVYLTEYGEQVYNNIEIGMSKYLNHFKAQLGKKSVKELNRILLSCFEVLQPND